MFVPLVTVCHVLSFLSISVTFTPLIALIDHSVHVQSILSISPTAPFSHSAFPLCSTTMGTKHMDLLSDFMDLGANIRATCTSRPCGHSRVLRAPTLYRLAALKGWQKTLGSMAMSMRCTVCGNQIGRAPGREKGDRVV